MEGGGGGLNFPEQKRAREGGRRDRVSRGGDRAGQRGEREPGQSEGKEVRGGMKEVGSTRTPRQREPPREEVRVPGPKNGSPGRRAGCSRKRTDSSPRRRLLLLRRVGGESGWVPPRDGPRRAQGFSVSPPPPHPASVPAAAFSSAAVAAFSSAAASSAAGAAAAGLTSPSKAG